MFFLLCSELSRVRPCCLVHTCASPGPSTRKSAVFAFSPAVGWWPGSRQAVTYNMNDHCLQPHVTQVLTMSIDTRIHIDTTSQWRMKSNAPLPANYEIGNRKSVIGMSSASISCSISSRSPRSASAHTGWLWGLKNKQIISTRSENTIPYSANILNHFGSSNSTNSLLALWNCVTVVYPII